MEPNKMNMGSLIQEMIWVIVDRLFTINPLSNSLMKKMLSGIKMKPLGQVVLEQMLKMIYGYRNQMENLSSSSSKTKL